MDVKILKKTLDTDNLKKRYTKLLQEFYEESDEDSPLEDSSDQEENEGGGGGEEEGDESGGIDDFDENVTSDIALEDITKTPSKLLIVNGVPTPDQKKLKPNILKQTGPGSDNAILAALEKYINYSVAAGYIPCIQLPNQKLFKKIKNSKTYRANYVAENCIFFVSA